MENSPPKNSPLVGHVASIFSSRTVHLNSLALARQPAVDPAQASDRLSSLNTCHAFSAPKPSSPQQLAISTGQAQELL